MSVQQLIKVAVARCDYPNQPRSALDPDYCRRLGENMKQHGQKVPVLGYSKGDRFILCDGGCRLEGARLAGIPELMAHDFGKEPTLEELLLAQASIDVHRQQLPALDRARLWARMCKEFSWTAKKLAEVLKVSESVVSRDLKLLALPEDIQQQINEGTLDARRGYLLTQESDPARQRELAVEAVALSRDELAKRVRKPKQSDAPQVRVKRIQLPLPSGVSFTVSGEELSLDDIHSALGELQRELRRGCEQGLDPKTLSKVLQDKAKKGSGQ